MNRNTMLAFFVWAIDVDALSLPVEKCWEMFLRDAWDIYSVILILVKNYCTVLILLGRIQLML